MKLSNVIRPNVLGWVEYKLSDKEMDYIWRCVDNKKQVKREGGTYDLLDRGDWFFTNCLTSGIKDYASEFTNLGSAVPISSSHPYKLASWWVSYQKKNEFFYNKLTNSSTFLYFIGSYCIFFSKKPFVSSFSG